MNRQCIYHSDCCLKYFCIDPSCTSKTKICCAECQIEGPHKKHDFKNISTFKNLIGDIAGSCCEYLKQFTEAEKIVQQIKEEFEYLRLYVNEVIEQLENNYIQYVKSATSTEIINGSKAKEGQIDVQSSWQTQIDQLNRLVGDTIRQGNEFLQNYDEVYLFSLYNKKEKLFNEMIDASALPFKEINKMKVNVINYFQGILSSSTQSLQIVNKSNRQDNHQRIQAFEISTFQKKLVQEIGVPGSNENQSLSGTHCIRSLQIYDDNHILLVTSDHIIRLCNKHTLKIVKEFKGHNWIVNNVIIINNDISGIQQERDNNTDINIFNSSLNQIISCSADTSIKLWNIKDSSIQQSIKTHSHEVTTIMLFNENTLISGGKDYMIYFYDIQYSEHNFTQDLPDKIRGNDDIEKNNNNERDDQQNNESLNNNDDQSKKSNQKTRMITEIKQTSELKYLEFPIRQIEKINEIFFIVGYSNGIIGLVECKQRQFLYSFQDKHELGLYSLAKVDESHFCSSGGDGKIKLWQVNQLRPIAEYKSSSSSYINRLKVLSVNKCLIASIGDTLEIISYKSFFPDNNDQTNQKQSTQNKLSFIEKKQLLKVLSLKLSKNTEINDFTISHFESEDTGIHQRFIIATQNGKLLYYS